MRVDQCQSPFFHPTLSLGMSFRSLPYFKKTLPAGCSGVMPTSSIVRMALVLASTLNSSHAYLITAVKGACSGTVRVLQGRSTSDDRIILNVTLLPCIIKLTILLHRLINWKYILQQDENNKIKVMEFGYFNPEGSQSQGFRATENEKSSMQQLMKELDPQGEGKVQGKSVVDLMKREGISNNDIRQIWLIANPGHDEYLEEDAMYVVLRLMSYSKVGVAISQDNLNNNIKAEPPVSPVSTPSAPFAQGTSKQIQTKVSSSVLVPDLERVNSFHNRWLTLEHKSSGLAKGTDIKKRYSEKAPKETLAQIWSACNGTVKGYLTKGEALMFDHLVDLKRRNVTINVLPEESKQLILEVDCENQHKIKSFKTEKELDKENPEKSDGVSTMVDDLERRLDSSNKEIQNLKMTLNQTRLEQARSMGKAIQTINRLRVVIERQNSQINDLKTTLESRADLDHKRAEFVEVCEIIEIEHPNYNFEKKETLILAPQHLEQQHFIPPKHSAKQPQPAPETVPSFPTPQPTSSLSLQQPYQSHQQSRRQSIPQPEPQPYQETQSQIRETYNLKAIRERTLAMILQMRPMSPEDIGLIERRLSLMSPEVLRKHYKEIEEKYRVEKPEAMDISITSTQKLEIIQNIFGNLPLEDEL